jgi:hypothetical protein
VEVHRTLPHDAPTKQAWAADVTRGDTNHAGGFPPQPFKVKPNGERKVKP